MTRDIFQPHQLDHKSWRILNVVFQGSTVTAKVLTAIILCRRGTHWGSSCGWGVDTKENGGRQGKFSRLSADPSQITKLLQMLWQSQAGNVLNIMMVPPVMWMLVCKPHENYSHIYHTPILYLFEICKRGYDYYRSIDEIWLDRST
jgi:hypothetical protein